MANQNSKLRRKEKDVEHRLYVLVQIGHHLVTAGTLELNDSGAEFSAQFTYAPNYLDQAQQGKAFALDPVNLPLRATPFQSTSRFYRLGALFDAAPDAWGRTVMAADAGVSPTSLSESQVLLKGKGSGVGAILFSPVEPQSETLAVDSTAHLPGIGDLDAIYETIHAIESGAQVDPELRDMLMSSWDIGGARPKVVVVDNQGQEWIVKFPRTIDTYSRQRVEWANLKMAEAIDICIPEIGLHELNTGDCALLVKRFDRTRDPETPTKILRNHYLSAVSLISPPANFDKRQLDSAFGASIFSYARIASVIRQVGENITRDLPELFARMVLNILVHNTDDHLKNTGFLLSANSTGYRYRLSPLFDVVTQEGTTKHMLHIGPGLTGQPNTGRIGSLENALAGSRSWGIKPEAAREIVDQVSAAVANRVHFYKEAGMTQEEINLVQRWVSADATSNDLPAGSSKPRG